MWRSLSPAVRTLLVALPVLALALALTYNHILLCDRAHLAGRYDVYREVGPVSYFGDYVLHHGEFPLWNPLTYCGMPYAANPISSAFYPPNLLRGCLTFRPTPLKTQVGWMVMMALHLLLGGCGMVFLAREHRLSYPAAFVAAFTFIFSAIWVRRICEYHFITMVGWLPLLLLLTRKALASPSWRPKLHYGLACGLILGMTLLSGSINIAPYAALSIVAYWGLYKVLCLRPWSPQPRAKTVRVLGGDVVFLVVVFLVAVLIGAALLLPGAELTEFSSRAKTGGYDLGMAKYRGSPRQLYHQLIRFPGLRWQTENIRGAGIGVFLLVLAALTYPKKRELMLYAGLFVVLFDCSLGPPFPVATLVYRLSPIQMVSSTRAFDFALIPLGILAGFGVHAAATQLKPCWWGLLRSCGIAAAGLLMLRSLAAMLGPDDYVPVTRLSIALPAATLAVVMLAGWIRCPRLWHVAVLVLIFAEMLSWNVRYIPLMVTRRNFRNWAGTFDGGDPFWSDNRRGTDKVVNRHLLALRPAINGYEPAHISRVRNVIAGAARLRRYSRIVSAEEATQDNRRANLFLKRSFWLARQYVEGPLPHRDVMFPSATTVFLEDGSDDVPVPRVEMKDVLQKSVSEKAVEAPILDPSKKAAALAVKAPRGRGFTIRLPPVTLDGTHTVLRLHYRSASLATVKIAYRDPTSGRLEYGTTLRIGATGDRERWLDWPLPDFDQLVATITVECQRSARDVGFTDAYLLSDRADEDARIEIIYRRANSVRVRVRDLDAPRILMFVDAAYPGWRAYLDSERVPIHLANQAFKAVVVPSGTHEVTFVFRPWRVYAGMAISGVTFLLVVGWLLVALRRGARTRSGLSGL